MDAGNGRFEQIIDAVNQEEIAQKIKEMERKFPNHGGWFQEGEIIELRGSKFRVKRIKPTEIVLKLLERGG